MRHIRVFEKNERVTVWEHPHDNCGEHGRVLTQVLSVEHQAIHARVLLDSGEALIIDNCGLVRAPEWSELDAS